ncbi:MAG: hypothetical protein JWL61_3415 [Gemmatimonadetes bacterium]|nr:hypothetical protein [Gemmatimonadota bacterium]
MPSSNPLRILLLAFAVAACGGDSASGGTASIPSTPSPVDGAASFAQIQNTILTPSCATSSCHIGSTPQGNLSLAADVAYANLINAVPANANARDDGLRRIIPGKPDSSLLYHKLVFPPGHHAHDYGNPMPTGTAGLSIGQLEFVRQWIAAGAPKSGVVADATLLANRSVQVTQPFAPLAAPASDAGFQLKVDQFPVSANFERELFTYRKIGNTSDVYVSRIETSMRPFSHHFVFYTLNSGIPPGLVPLPDVVRDIRKPDNSMDIGNMLAMGFHVFLGGSMQAQSNYVFPAGTALRLPANAAIDLNVHYANHTDAPVQGEAYVNFYTVPQSQVVHSLSTLNLQNTAMILPPGQVTTATKEFLFNAPTTITALTSHMHARGTKFQIRIVGGPRDDEVVYENTDWEHPQIVSYPKPIVLDKGQGLRSVVTWNNTTSRTLAFGLTSDDEMAIIFGYYY